MFFGPTSNEISGNFYKLIQFTAIFSFLQLNIYLFLILLLKAATEGTSNRNIIYDEGHVGKKMKRGKVVKTFQHISKISCALHCSRDESCYSFTFCGQKVCYLNSDNGMSFVEAPGCHLYSTKKETRGKTEFEHALETTSVPITQSPDTFCFPSSKGNGLKCIESNGFEQWYWVSASGAKWDGAVDICQVKHGVLLFSKTWSSHDSVEGFMNLLILLGYNTDQIWVGIRKVGFVGLMDALGGIQSNVTLGPATEDTFPGDCLYAVNSGLYLLHCDAILPFICELTGPVE